jgi:hypothetical protein
MQVTVRMLLPMFGILLALYSWMMEKIAVEKKEKKKVSQTIQKG